jgi:hypothetical protein
VSKKAKPFSVAPHIADVLVRVLFEKTKAKLIGRMNHRPPTIVAQAFASRAVLRERVVQVDSVE